MEIIASDQGHHKMLSCVAFTNEESLIDKAAKNKTAINSTDTVFDVKRLIEEAQSSMKHWPFKVIYSSDSPKIEAQYCGETKHFIAEQVSSMVLLKMQ